ncbi:hypothetical protein AWN76_006045 [Rhodothermaceae bacterium RA]|nr:hypothetical protein AWN76_006045 [Rhodothermaceae bacterium RA]
MHGHEHPQHRQHEDRPVERGVIPGQTGRRLLTLLCHGFLEIGWRGRNKADRRRSRTDDGPAPVAGPCRKIIAVRLERKQTRRMSIPPGRSRPLVTLPPRRSALLRPMPTDSIRPARLAPSRIVPTYTWIAPVHDGLAWLVAAKARRLGLNRAAVRDGETVVEVAVGTGLSFRHLLLANPHGWTEGIDLTPAMLRRAERRAARTGRTNYRLRLGNARALPYPDAYADLLVNSYMFDLLPVADFVPVLREFHRVLKPGGRLIMMNMTVGTRWIHHLWEGLYRLYPPLLGGCRGVAVAPYCEQAGFAHVRRAFVSQWSFPSEVIHAEKPS